MSRTSRQWFRETSETKIGLSPLDFATQLQRARQRSVLDARMPGTLPQASLPSLRPKYICTPRGGGPSCPAFDLSTARVVAVPSGTTVPAYGGRAGGLIAGGETMQILLPNGHFGLGYLHDFKRAPTADRVGQGPVDVALRLQQARAVTAPRLPGNARVEIPPIPTREELLRRAGIIEGRAVVSGPRGVQIWSNQTCEYRPGTGIPLKTRRWVLPRGTPVTLTPNRAMIEAAMNGVGDTCADYFVAWDVRRQPYAFAFQMIGIPVAGNGYADAVAEFQRIAVPT